MITMFSSKIVSTTQNSTTCFFRMRVYLHSKLSCTCFYFRLLIDFGGMIKDEVMCYISFFVQVYSKKHLKDLKTFKGQNDFGILKGKHKQEIAEFPLISLQNVLVFLANNKSTNHANTSQFGINQLCFLFVENLLAQSSRIFQQLFAYLICLLHRPRFDWHAGRWSFRTVYKPWLISERIIDTVHFFREIFLKEKRWRALQ